MLRNSQSELGLAVQSSCTGSAPSRSSSSCCTAGGWSTWRRGRSASRTTRGTRRIGYDLLALLVLRLLWRWMNPVPAMPGDLKRWEVIAAQAPGTSASTCSCSRHRSPAGGSPARSSSPMTARPVRATDSADRVATARCTTSSKKSHMITSYLLAALIVVHIAGSLRHHFVKRNDVMRRMWFGSTAPQDASRTPVQPRLRPAKAPAREPRKTSRTHGRPS